MSSAALIDHLCSFCIVSLHTWLARAVSTIWPGFADVGASLRVFNSKQGNKHMWEGVTSTEQWAPYQRVYVLEPLSPACDSLQLIIE